MKDPHLVVAVAAGFLALGPAAYLFCRLVAPLIPVPYKLKRILAKRRKQRERLYILVDFHPFGMRGTRVLLARGLPEARRKAKQWVRLHPWGSAQIARDNPKTPRPHVPTT